MNWMDWIVESLWSLPTFVTLLFLGILFSIWSKFVQFRALTHGVAVIQGKYDETDDPGAINHFQALSAALSGTVGLGNIGGVALAIAMGGPGALFWMWVTGFLGMAVKTVEVTLAMMYRDTSNPQQPYGGAMYVVTRSLPARANPVLKSLAWLLAVFFCLTLLLAAITGGNMFQSWNVAAITNQYFGVPGIASGIVLAVATGVVILGGIQRIGDVAGRLVPFMCGLYLLSGVAVLIVKAANVPALLGHVVTEAFSPTSAQGAFLGATAWYGLTTGLRRALFSNEAGQGTSPIAHSAARTSEPVREGIVAGLEPFVDTCLVCTLTALVILSTNTWNREADGPFGGEIRIVQNGEKWSVTGSTDSAHLPPLPAPDVWAPGNGFFLLAEVPVENESSGTRLARVKGHLEGDASGTNGLKIVWDEPPAGAVLLKDQGIYRDLVGASLTGLAYDRAIPGLGKYMVTAACWLFAFSTLISWSYYGETAMVFLLGRWSVMPYRFVYCLSTAIVTLPGMIKTDVDLGNLSDIGTGFMLVANVPIILIMAPIAMRAIRDYFARLDSGAFGTGHEAGSIVEIVEDRKIGNH
ncbi:amino acid carrier protein [bacterium]|nr:amino acid carrier protein [bacterium]